jgi:hypothetical protein
MICIGGTLLASVARLLALRVLAGSKRLLLDSLTVSVPPRSMQRLTHLSAGLTEFNSTTNSTLHDDVHFPLNDPIYIDFTHDTTFTQRQCRAR